MKNINTQQALLLKFFQLYVFFSFFFSISQKKSIFAVQKSIYLYVTHILILKSHGN